MFAIGFFFYHKDVMFYNVKKEKEIINANEPNHWPKRKNVVKIIALKDGIDTVAECELK